MRTPLSSAWSEEYHIFAPAWDQRKKKVRYREIKTIGQIVLDRQSDFSPKEAYYPVSQTMFYFTDTAVCNLRNMQFFLILMYIFWCEIAG